MGSPFAVSAFEQRNVKFNLVFHTEASPFAGLLVPVSVISFLWLSLLEDDSQLRPPLCGTLVTSRYIMGSGMENVKKFAVSGF